MYLQNVRKHLEISREMVYFKGNSGFFRYGEQRDGAPVANFGVLTPPLTKERSLGKVPFMPGLQLKAVNMLIPPLYTQKRGFISQSFPVLIQFRLTFLGKIPPILLRRFFT
jgi:hypothetical protein